MPDFTSYPPQVRTHHRTRSQASNHSSHSAISTQSAPNVPTPTMEHLMRTIALAPRGSKLAQDAAKALLVAESERRTRTGVPLSPIPSPGLPQEPPRRPEPPAAALIGAKMMEDNLGEDPFDLDVPEDVEPESQGSSSSSSKTSPTFTPSPGGLGQWPLIPSYPPPAAQPSEKMRKPSLDLLIGGQESTPPGVAHRPLVLPEDDLLPPLLHHVMPSQAALAIFWRGAAPQKFAIITDRAGPTGTDDTFPITVAANHTQIIEMPRAWAGFIQRITDDINTPATRAHVAFDAYKAFSFFFVNYVHGNNGPVFMQAEPSGVRAGSRLRAVSLAPPSILGTSPNKSQYVLPTWHGPNHRREAIVRFYQNFFSSPQSGAVLSQEEAEATQVTRDRHIVLDFA